MPEDELSWRLLLVFECPDPKCSKLHTKTFEITEQDARDHEIITQIATEVCENIAIDPMKLKHVHVIAPQEPVSGVFRAMSDAHMVPPLPLPLGGWLVAS